MSIVSYAQNLEDVMLWRALKDVKNGFYIDVGAAWPETDSVTKVFYEKDWHGINIEPNPVLFEQLRNQRAKDINLSVAVSDETCTMDMSFIGDTGLSTLDENIAKRHAAKGWDIEKHSVEVTTLADIWSKHVPPDQEVQFLKIDVEGLEREVLLGNDWSNYRPWIVVVESTEPLTQDESHFEWEDILLSENYLFAYADGLNRFYIDQSQSELLEYIKYPPNIFDDFISIGQQKTELQARQSEASALEANERARQSEASALEANERARQSEASALEANERARYAEDMAQQASEQTRHVTRQLESLYCSRSWRITAPFRWLGHQVRLLNEHGIFSRIKALFKKFFRPFISWSASFIKPRAGLRYRCYTLTRRMGIYESLRPIYLRSLDSRLLTKSTPNQHLNMDESMIDHLTPQARRVYVDIKKALAQRDQGGA